MNNELIQSTITASSAEVIAQEQNLPVVGQVEVADFRTRREALRIVGGRFYTYHVVIKSPAVAVPNESVDDIRAAAKLLLEDIKLNEIRIGECVFGLAVFRMPIIGGNTQTTCHLRFDLLFTSTHPVGNTDKELKRISKFYAYRLECFDTPAGSIPSKLKKFTASVGLLDSDGIETTLADFFVGDFPRYAEEISQDIAGGIDEAGGEWTVIAEEFEEDGDDAVFDDEALDIENGEDDEEEQEDAELQTSHEKE